MDVNEWISDTKKELDTGLYVEFRASVEAMLLVLAEVERLQAENARLKGEDKPADDPTQQKQWQVTHKWGSE